MPQTEDRFTVIIEKPGTDPITLRYSDLDAARLAALGFVGCLAPGDGGEVYIRDGSGKRLQKWSAG